jgi:hypothetical protein
MLHRGDAIEDGELRLYSMRTLPDGMSDSCNTILGQSLSCPSAHGLHTAGMDELVQPSIGTPDSAVPRDPTSIESQTL